MRAYFLLALGLLSISALQARQNLFEGCPIPGYEDTDSVECGYIQVPENRNDPNSRQINLAYLILKARSKDPQPDPIVYLQGGPGGATLSTLGFWENSQLRIDRDFILIDQRGTGYSAAVCTDLGTKMMMAMAEDFTLAEEKEYLTKAAATCKAEIKNEGVDVEGYNTIQNAKDLDALRQELGYDNWNLFGGSYGSRLALAYMRDFPEHTRSAVLSGLFPPQINLYETFITNFNRSLNWMFEACKSDYDCNKRYPELKKTYFEVLHSLSERPYTFKWGGEPFVLNPQDMLMLTHQMLYARFTIGQIPSLVKAIQERDDRVLRQSVQTLSARAQLINFAMNWSFNAHDEMTFTTTQDLRDDLDRNPELKPGPAFFMSDPELLEGWHDHKAPAYVNEPVVSDIPTLLANGNFDPVTPPGNAIEALKTLKNAYYAEFAVEGHSVFGACYFGMVEEFLKNPGKEPDMECAKRSGSVYWK